MHPNVETFIGCDSSYRAASIVLYGAPYDSTTSYRPGARFGPAAIRHHRIGRGAVGDADRVAPLAEQIDHRHAAQPQVLRAKGLQQARGVAVGPELA